MPSWGSQTNVNNQNDDWCDKKDEKTDSKDHGTSSYDSKQDSDRRSTGSGRKEVNPIKCRFYKSPGDESTVERREFEIWGPITFNTFVAMLIRKFKLVEPIFEHYKLFAVMKNGERWTVTEEDEFDRIYQDFDIKMDFIIERKQWKILKTRLGKSKQRMMSLFS